MLRSAWFRVFLVAALAAPLVGCDINPDGPSIPATPTSNARPELGPDEVEVIPAPTKPGRKNAPQRRKTKSQTSPRSRDPNLGVGTP